MAPVTYVKLLGSRGVSSVCVANDGSPLAMKCVSSNIKIFTLTKKSSWLTKVRQLRTIIDSQNAETIFVHRLKDLGVLVPALIGKPNVKVIGIGHMLLKSSKRDPVHRLLYSRVQTFVTFTEIQKQLLMPKLPLADKTYVTIPMGVDCNYFHPTKRDEAIRKDFGVADDECLVGMVGRFDRQKGQLEFVQALKILNDQNVKFKAVFVGAPTVGESQNNYDLEVLNTVKGTSLESKVIFAGFLPDITKFMASLDIFVLPSYQETFGLVLLEAMASGVTVLATNAGGPPEILGDKEALFDPRSPQSLAKILAKYIGSPELRKSLSEKLLTRVRKVYGDKQFADELARMSATQGAKS